MFKTSGKDNNTPGYITSIKLNRESDEGLPKNLEWENIPMFSVITGKNGIGKTKLLEAIINGIYKKDDSIKITYRDENRGLLQVFFESSAKNFNTYGSNESSKKDYESYLEKVIQDFVTYSEARVLSEAKVLGSKYKVKFSEYERLYQTTCEQYSHGNAVLPGANYFAEYSKGLKEYFKEQWGQHISIYTTLEAYSSHLLAKITNLYDLNKYLEKNAFKYIISPDSYSIHDDKVDQLKLSLEERSNITLQKVCYGKDKEEMSSKLKEILLEQKIVVYQHIIIPLSIQNYQTIIGFIYISHYFETPKIYFYYYDEYYKDLINSLAESLEVKIEPRRITIFKDIRFAIRSNADFPNYYEKLKKDTEGEDILPDVTLLELSSLELSSKSEPTWQIVYKGDSEPKAIAPNSRLHKFLLSLVAKESKENSLTMIKEDKILDEVLYEMGLYNQEYDYLLKHFSRRLVRKHRVVDESVVYKLLTDLLFTLIQKENKIDKNELAIEEKVVSLYQLSPGEQIELLVLLWLYNQDEFKTSANALFLLDEPDAHLHPSLTKKFIDTIKTKLVEQNNIQVIMTTHNPSTISLLPQYCIYVMSNDYPDKKVRIIKAETKRQAMPLLTSNLVFVNEPFRIVFVEARNDVKFYQTIREILIERKIINSDFQILFKAHGKKEIVKKKVKEKAEGKVEEKAGEDNSSRGLVIRLVEACVNTGNDDTSLVDFIFGIVDGDNLPPPNCKNVKSLTRYAIENYIYDPIYIYFSLKDKKLDIEQFNTVNQNIEEAFKQQKLESPKSLSEVLNKEAEKTLQIIIDEMAKCFRNYLQEKVNNDSDFKNIKDTLCKPRFGLLVDNKLIEAIEKVEYEVENVDNIDNVKLKYPQIFLKMKGHHLEFVYSRLFKAAHKSIDKGHIISLWRCYGMLVPVELIQIFKWLQNSFDGVNKTNSIQEIEHNNQNENGKEFEHSDIPQSSAHKRLLLPDLTQEEMQTNYALELSKMDKPLQQISKENLLEERDLYGSDQETDEIESNDGDNKGEDYRTPSSGNSSHGIFHHSSPPVPLKPPTQESKEKTDNDDGDGVPFNRYSL